MSHKEEAIGKAEQSAATLVRYLVYEHTADGGGLGPMSSLAHPPTGHWPPTRTPSLAAQATNGVNGT